MSPRAPGNPILPLLCAILALAGCSDPVEDPVPNQRPFVRISGGPPEAAEDSYTTRVWWTGWDDDGIISHYEYAIDPPPAFSEAEVNAPESFPEIQRVLIRGPEVGRDTLRFIKSLDGAAHSFDYIQTTDFSRVFAFQTPHADTGHVGGGQRGPLPRYSGVHALYIRSMDNEGAYSDVDRLGYTAVTVTPTSTITKPRLGARILIVGPQINVSWEGEDPDATDVRRRPVGYLYKLVRLDRLSPPIPILAATDAGFILHWAARNIPWEYRSADTLGVSLHVEPGPYVFGVRAVDQAGGIEPYVDFSRPSGANAFSFSVIASGGSPVLTVSEPSLGTATFRGLGSLPVHWQVAVGQRLFFNWHANADEYGGVIEGYNWGVDIPDIEREGPNSGWRGWSLLNGNFEPVLFKEPGFHVIYVKVRDGGGSLTLAPIFLTVIDFPLDRELLLVDDYRDGVSPRDNQHDAFWLRLVNESGRFTENDLRPERLWYSAYGPQDILNFDPVAPDLSVLSRYRQIFWNTKGGGSGGTNALLKTAPLNRHLSTYLRAGGKLWVSGEMTVASTILTEGRTGNFNYPHELQPGMFAWDFFRIYSGRVDNIRYTDLDRHGLAGVVPYPNGPQPFGAMTLDPSKQRAGLAGVTGVGGTDIVMDPIFESTNPRFSGRIDSLYAYQAFGPFKDPSRGSPYQGRLCAIRYSDPDPERTQGKTVWFGFSLYYLKTTEVQEVFNAVVDWFREEDGVE